MNKTVISLSEASIGTYRCVDFGVVGDVAIRLKQLGLCRGLVLQLVATGNPMILRLGQTEIGLSRALADSVRVTSIADKDSLSTCEASS